MGSWKIVNQPTDREIKFKMTTKGDEIITKISTKKKTHRGDDGYGAAHGRIEARKQGRLRRVENKR